MKSMQCININGYQYKDYPELLKALVTVKKAALISAKNLKRADDSLLDKLILTCDQFLQSDNVLNIQVSIYAGTKANLVVAVDEALIKIFDYQNTQEVNKAKDILHSCGAVNALIATASEMVVQTNLLKLVEACSRFSLILNNKAAEFGNAVKMARIGLQDYLPMTYAEEFKGYAFAVDQVCNEIRRQAEDFHYNALGFSESGSEAFFDHALSLESSKILSSLLNKTFVPYENGFDAVMGTTRWLLAHASVQALSTVVWRIARDVRMMCSGPRAGLQEITVPAVAPGSSIMPGKLNPVIAEMVFTTADQVDANHAGLCLAQKSGWLEGGSGSFVPIRSLMNSCDLLARTMDSFGELCLKGITLNIEHSLKHAQRSLALAWVLELYTDKETAKKVYEHARTHNLTIEESALRLNVLPEEVVRSILDVNKLSDPTEIENIKRS